MSDVVASLMMQSVVGAYWPGRALTCERRAGGPRPPLVAIVSAADDVVSAATMALAFAFASAAAAAALAPTASGEFANDLCGR